MGALTAEPSACTEEAPVAFSPRPPTRFPLPVGLSLPGGPIAAVFTGVMSIGSSEAEVDSDGVAECECVGRGLWAGRDSFLKGLCDRKGATVAIA